MSHSLCEVGVVSAWDRHSEIKIRVIERNKPVECGRVLEWVVERDADADLRRNPKLIQGAIGAAEGFGGVGDARNAAE
jgi:hypothetical protein